MKQDAVQAMCEADATIQSIEVVPYNNGQMMINALTDIGDWVIYEGPTQMSEDVLQWLLNVACGGPAA